MSASAATEMHSPKRSGPRKDRARHNKSQLQRKRKLPAWKKSEGPQGATGWAQETTGARRPGAPAGEGPHSSTGVASAHVSLKPSASPRICAADVVLL